MASKLIKVKKTWTRICSHFPWHSLLGSGHSPLAWNQTLSLPPCPTCLHSLYLRSKENTSLVLSKSKPYRKKEVVCGEKVSKEQSSSWLWFTFISIQHFELTFNRIKVPKFLAALLHHHSTHSIFRWTSSGSLREPWTWYPSTRNFPRPKLPLTLSTSPRYYPAPEENMA